MGTRKGLSIVDVTADDLACHAICGYKNPESIAHRRKTEWFGRRFDEGLGLKVLHSETDGTIGSIEYLPGEHSWRAVIAPGAVVIHCIFILKKNYKGKGYGSLLIEACEKDARKRKMHGVAVVTSDSTWMAKKQVFLKRGYRQVDEAPPHHQLLFKSFNKLAPLPSFTGDWDWKLARYSKGLTILHSAQCPYVAKTMAEIPQVAKEEFGIESRVVELTDSRQARNSPNPYGIFSVIWNGELVADHPISKTRFKNIMKKVLA